MAEKIDRGNAKVKRGIEENLHALATSYEGKALILPSVLKISEAIGVKSTQLYRHEDGLEGAFHDATGLSIISHAGLVLGDATGMRPFDAEFAAEAKANLEVDKIAAQADSLTQEQRTALIARLAIDG